MRRNKTGVEPLQWGEMDTFTLWSFQASGPYSRLSEGQFVANIRMYPPDNDDTVVYIDYRISEVQAGPVCED